MPLDAQVYIQRPGVARLIRNLAVAVACTLMTLGLCALGLNKTLLPWAMIAAMVAAVMWALSGAEPDRRRAMPVVAGLIFGLLLHSLSQETDMMEEFRSAFLLLVVGGMLATTLREFYLEDKARADRGM